MSMLRWARLVLFLFILGYFAGLAALVLAADSPFSGFAFWLTLVSGAGAVCTSIVALAAQIRRGVSRWRGKQVSHG